MSSFASWVGMLEIASGTAELGVQWLVQSTLVLAAGLAAASLLRSRGAAIQSAVYRTTLVATLACPVVATLLSFAGLTFVAVRLPELRVETEELVLVPAPVQAPAPVVAPIPAETTRAAPLSPATASEAGERRETQRPLRFPAATASLDGSRELDVASGVLSKSPVALETPPDEPAAEPIFAIRTVLKTRMEMVVAVIVISSAWLLGSFALMLRLMVEYLRLARLCRSAVQADEEDRRLCVQLAAGMKVAAPALLRTPYLSSPCLAGILRPTILLPEELPSELSAVLVHELAHLARGDGRWNLLRHLTAALLYPQPLVWRLSRRIEAVAEEVCDDHVVQFGTDRHAYAETLVTLAEGTLLPASGAVVSLVTLRSLLAQRITRILDQSHRLSLSVGLAVLCLIAVIGVSAALVAGLFGPGVKVAANTLEKSDEQDEAGPSKDEPSGSTGPQPAVAATPSRNITGRVFMPDGKPASGANAVLIARRRASYYGKGLDQSSEIDVLGQTRCDERGRFELTADGLTAAPYFTVQLLLRTDGCGLAWRDVNADQEQLDFDVTLPRASEARGRLVTSEGRGAAGIRIQVDKIGKSGAGDFVGVNSMRAKLPSEVWPGEVVTDAEGRFVVPGVAADTDLHLYASQEPFAPHWWMWKEDDKSEHAEVLSPAQVITGVVVAADTGKPLAHARLTAFQAGDAYRNGSVGIDGQADAEGRFRMNPFAANSFIVSAFAPVGTPYLARKAEFEWPLAATEHEVRLELPRGVLLNGTILDETSGQPITGASVRYEAGRANKFARDNVVTGWQAGATSDENGRYAIAVPPGPGYVTVLCPGGQYVVQPTTTSFLHQGKPGGRRLYVHAYKTFDIEPDAKQQLLDLKVTHGLTVWADVVGPDGTTPERMLMMYRGMQAPWSEEFGNSVRAFPGGRLEIGGVPPDGELTIYLLDPVLKNGRVVNLRAKDAGHTLRIELAACGSATLRCVDAEGKPIPGAQAYLNMVFTPGTTPFEMSDEKPQEDQTSAANFDRLNHWELMSGEGGWIKYVALIPGLDYQLFGTDEQEKIVVERVIRVRPGEQQQLNDYVIRNPKILQECESRWLKKQQEKAADKRNAAIETPPAANTPTHDDDLLVVRGRVVDPDGKPFVGADVLAMRQDWSFPDERRPLTQAKTDAEGRFEIRFPRSPFEGDFTKENQWRDTSIVAIAKGFGAGFVRHHELAGGEATLRLAADGPIEGRIVDLEGRPKAGVKVRVTSIAYRSSGDLTPWLDALRRGESYFEVEEQYGTDHYILTDFAPLAITAQTDTDGRFRLQGVGKNRTAGLRIEGGGVVTADLRVVTVATGPISMKFLNRPTPFFNRTEMLYGARFQYAAEPAQPIAGVVRDAHSGEPLAGVRVQAYQFAGKKGSEQKPEEVISDGQGRYRLEGMPKGEGNEVRAIPADGQPYFIRNFPVSTAVGLQTIALDLDVYRGVLIHGRLSHKPTGEAISAAWIQYSPWPFNPLLKNLPEDIFHEYIVDRYLTDRDGRFTVVGLPGRGLVTARVWDRPFPRGQGVSDIADLPPNQAFVKITQQFGPSDCTAVRQVNPADADSEVTADLAIDPGQRLNLKIVDPQGQPLSGLTINGLWPLSQSHIGENIGPDVMVEAIGPDEKRWLLVSHPQRGLGKAIQIGTEDVVKGPLTVVTEPCATITGRLRNDVGDSVRDGFVFFEVAGVRDYALNVADMPIDKDGSFTNKQILPGCHYRVHANAPGIEFATLAEDLSVKPGETIDLGEFDVTKEDRPEPKRTTAVAAPAKSEQTAGAGALHKEDRVVLNGRVLGADGKPVAGAVVRTVPAELEDGPWERKAPLKTVKTDAAGRFQVTLAMTQGALAEWPRFWPLAMTVAWAPGSGLAWTHSMPSDAGQEMTLRLVADQVIEGRVVGLEGQPIAGVQAQVVGLETNEKEDLSAWLDALRSGTPPRDAQKIGGPDRRLGNAPAQWSTDRNLVDIHATTGPDGRFHLAGVGRGRVAYLQLSGAGIVTTRLWVVAGAMEPVKLKTTERIFPNDPTYLGTPFQFVAENSQPIEGLVRDAKSGQPLAGVRIMSDQFARSRLSGNHLVKTVSDDRGHYRLEGMPQGKGNRILALPGDDQPYFMREFDVPASESFEPVKLDVELHRGVWITGRVTERATGRAARGRMFYLPWPDNPAAEGLREFNDGKPPGPHDRYSTDADGRYRLVGLPGRGLVEFWYTEVRRPFPSGQGVSQIADLPPDDDFKKISMVLTPRQTFVTAIKEVRAENENAQVTADIVLNEGQSIAVNLVDPAGEPLSGVTAHGLWPVTQYYDAENLGPKVEVAALSPDEERILMLEHPGRKLGKWLKVSAAEHGAGPLTVTLDPAATVKARLLDKDGEPVVGAKIEFRYPCGPNFIQHLSEIITDADGRFTHSAVPVGCKYQIHCESRRVGLKNVVKELSVEAGETVDLGEFDVTSETRPEPKRTAAAQKTAAADGAVAVKVDTNQQAAAGDPSDRLEFAGKVVDPNGKPVAGAKIHLLYYTLNNFETRPVDQTDASGAFDFAVSKKDFDTGEMNEPWQAAYVVATAPGYGLEAASTASFEKSEALLAEMRAKPNFSEKYANFDADRMLRLVADDVPIEGRILNLEGQPVVGATVQVIEIHLNRENSLDPWLHAVENEKADFYQAREHVMHGFHGRHLSGQVSQLFPKVVTGADGRFRIDGIGRERIVMMQIQGPGIETREVYSRTRAGKSLRVADDRRDPEGNANTFYPAKFDFPAAPSRPVIGVVRDVDSLKPLAGVTIRAQRIAGQRTSGWTNAFIHAKTDAEGRYRIEGLPIGENELMAAPKGEEPYLIASHKVETSPTQDTTTLDFKLKRGVWIRGRVTDATTGNPLRARVEYFAFRENPNIKSAPGLMRAWDEFRTADADGRFAVPGLPGRGLIAVMADNHRDYPRGAGADDIKGGRGDDQGMMFRTSPYSAGVSNFHHFVEVNPAADADAVECAIALVAGKRLDGTVLDPEGKPLSGAMFFGENEFMYSTPLGDATFSVHNLEPNKPRRIQFFHKGRKLAGSMLITGDETGPLYVKLEPWGVVTGRVLDENGSPAEKVTIGSANHQHQKVGQVGVLPESKPLQTGDDGRFRIEGLAPGVEYSLSASRGNQYLGIVSETLQVSAGETKDLGDLTIKPSADQSNNKPPAKNDASQAAAKIDGMDRLKFAGTIVDSAGTPVRGAKIFMIRFDYIALGATALKPLAETKADGGFEFTVTGKDFHPLDAYIHWGFTPLVATAEGHALAWSPAASFESSGAVLKELRADPKFSEQDSTLPGDRTLRLPEDDLPIEGRIVNLEGLPIAAARVKVIEIQCFPRTSLDAWIKLAQSKISAKSPELWRGVDELNLSEQVRQLFPDVATGADGRFRIDGIGRERVVRLQIEAPAIETRRVYVRTQRGGAIKVGDGSGGPNSGDKTIYAASFEFPLGPSRPVTGVVRDVDTQMPLAGVTIQIDQMAGDPDHVWPKESLRTTTDAEGRYSVTGLPIGENSLMALAPFDQPYMLAVQECDTGSVKESLQLDFNLKRGVWVRGRVTDAATGQGVRADVEYYAMLDNPHQTAAPNFWGAQWRPHLTDAEGRFAIPAFAGRGLIAVRAHDYRAYPRGVGADKIAGGKYEDGVVSITFRTNPTILTANDHSAIREVNPAEGVDASDVDFVLKSGKSLAGTVLDPEGKPLDGATFSGEVEQTSRWKPLKESSFAVRNLQPGKLRRLLFVHEQRQLAGSVLLTGEESGPLSVKLEPWGVISGRALDKNGEPLRTVNLVPWFKVADKLQHGALPSPNFPRTDDEGRFTVEGLAPRVEYLFYASTDKRYLGTAVEDVKVSAGETKDLGDVTLKSSE